MKRLFLLSFILAAMAFAAGAEKTSVYVCPQKNASSSDNKRPDRAPLKLPLSVIYDSEANTLEIWCEDCEIEAEVTVYDNTGNIEAYSPVLNVVLPLSSSDYHTLYIQTDEWSAETSFSISCSNL